MSGFFDESPTTTPTATDEAVENLLNPDPAFHQMVARGSVDYSSFAALVRPEARRDTQAKLKAAAWIGSMLGQDAYYSWTVHSKSGENSRVEGPTVDLAYALALEWGFNASRVVIVDRKDATVFFRAAYIDLITYVFVERDYVSTIRPAPGKFAEKPEEKERWEVMQIQSAASKAVRGALIRGMPTWFVVEALRAARRAVQGKALKEGQTLEQAVAEAIKAFGASGWATEAVLVEYLGRPSKLWTVEDIVTLRETGQSIIRGEVTAAGVFGEILERIAGGQPPPPADGPLPTGQPRVRKPREPRPAAPAAGAPAAPPQAAPAAAPASTPAAAPPPATAATGATRGAAPGATPPAPTASADATMRDRIFGLEQEIAHLGGSIEKARTAAGIPTTADIMRVHGIPSTFMRYESDLRQILAGLETDGEAPPVDDGDPGPEDPNGMPG
jgi:hypothetical protein